MFHSSHPSPSPPSSHPSHPSPSPPSPPSSPPKTNHAAPRWNARCQSPPPDSKPTAPANRRSFPPRAALARRFANPRRRLFRGPGPQPFANANPPPRPEANTSREKPGCCPAKADAMIGVHDSPRINCSENDGHKKNARYSEPASGVHAPPPAAALAEWRRHFPPPKARCCRTSAPQPRAKNPDAPPCSDSTRCSFPPRPASCNARPRNADARKRGCQHPDKTSEPPPSTLGKASPMEGASMSGLTKTNPQKDSTRAGARRMFSLSDAGDLLQIARGAEFPLKVVGPRVIGADDVALSPAAFFGQEGMSAVPADIKKRAQFPVVSAHGENPASGGRQGGVVPRISQLRLMRGEGPGGGENILPRPRKNLRRKNSTPPPTRADRRRRRRNRTRTRQRSRMRQRKRKRGRKSFARNS